MKRIKTIADVQQVPAGEFIYLFNLENGTCPFCGERLRGKKIGIGRDQCVQYFVCSCPTAQAAKEHNEAIK